MYRALSPYLRRSRTPESAHPARDRRRHLLHREERSCLASAAPRFSSLEDRPPLLQDLAYRWHLGEDALSPAEASGGAPEEEPSAQRRDSRQPVRQHAGGGAPPPPPRPARWPGPDARQPNAQARRGSRPAGARPSRCPCHAGRAENPLSKRGCRYTAPCIRSTPARTRRPWPARRHRRECCSVQQQRVTRLGRGAGVATIVARHRRSGHLPHRPGGHDQLRAPRRSKRVCDPLRARRGGGDAAPRDKGRRVRSTCRAQAGRRCGIDARASCGARRRVRCGIVLGRWYARARLAALHTGRRSRRCAAPGCGAALGVGE
jgi:hypothetical protein